MKSIVLVLGTMLMSGAVLCAHEVATPKYELGLDHSWLHVNSANSDSQRSGNGGSGYFEYNLNRTIGLVGDFGGYANTRTGVNDKALTCLFGPRFNWRHSRLNPYVQFLVGGAYAWAGPTGNSNTQNAFAMAAGGGLDVKLTQHIAIKPVQVEYVMTRFDSASLGGSTTSFGNHQNDIRYSAGVVFQFGSK
jgi:opacity protein-like surface antigen